MTAEEIQKKLEESEKKMMEDILNIFPQEDWDKLSVLTQSRIQRAYIQGEVRAGERYREMINTHTAALTKTI